MNFDSANATLEDRLRLAQEMRSLGKSPSEIYDATLLLLYNGYWRNGIGGEIIQEDINYDKGGCNVSNLDVPEGNGSEASKKTARQIDEEYLGGLLWNVV